MRTPATTPVTGPGTDDSATTLLAAHTTLRLGGPARRLVRATTADEVIAAATEADTAREPLLLVGGGSNLVVGDDGFPGTVLLLDHRGHHVVRHGETSGEESSGGETSGGETSGGEVLVHVEAGDDWDAFVAATVEAGFGGLECLSGIPGRVGATPVQNVGAYGVEVAERLVDVDLHARRTAATRSVPAAHLGLAYRTSRLKGERNVDAEIVLAARFRLTTDGLSAPIRYAELARALDVEPGARVPAADARAAVVALRRSKGMVVDDADPDSWSAGSFFTNPVVGADVAAAVAARCEAGGLAPVAAWPVAGTATGTATGQVKLSAAGLIERAGIPRGHPGPGSPVRVSTKHTLALTHPGGGTTADLLALARDVRGRVRGRFDVELVPEPVLVACSL